MDPPPGTPAHHAMVGRLDERRRLAAAVAVVAGGAGRAVLIHGAPGIGKTRLAREALSVSAAHGFRTLHATSNPLNTTLAYAPMVEAFGRALRDLDAPERAAVSRDLPALSWLLPGSLPAAAALVGDPELDRVRLFEAVLRLLDRLSRSRPVALLLDDLQWFDTASLELLAYVGRDLSSLPVLVIGTVRTESGATARLSALLRLLRRVGRAEELTLGPLRASEIEELVEASFGARAERGLVEELTRRSGGIPLFAEALLSDWKDRGELEHRGGQWRLLRPPSGPPPAVVRDAVLDRLDGLTPEDQEFLEVFAVGGEDVPLAVLAEVGGQERDLLSQFLDRLVERGLLRDEADGGDDRVPRYRFAHPLYLEAIYARMPSDERRALHARYAAVLDRDRPDDVERLAFHLLRAEPVPPARALAICVAAGERALQRYANEDAVRHFRTALSYAEQATSTAAGGNSGGKHDGDVDLPAIHWRLGEAAARSGDLSAATTALQKALEGYLAAGERKRTVLMHRRLAELLAERGEVVLAEAHVREGLALLADEESSEAAVELVLVRLDIAVQEADPASAAAAAGEVERWARDLPSRWARAAADFAHGVSLAMRGEFLPALQVLAPAQAAMTGEDPRFLVRQEGLVGMSAAFRGDLGTLREANRRTLVVARRVGIPTTHYRLHLLTFVEHLYAGEWDRAEEVVAEARLAAEFAEHPRIAALAPAIDVVLSSLQGDLGAAERALRTLRQRILHGTVPRGQGEKLAAVLGAFHAIESDDPAGALRSIGRARGHYLPELIPPWGWAVRGEAEARTGRSAAALRTAAELAALSPDGSYPASTARRIRGLAALSNGRRESIRELRGAAEQFDDLGMPFEAARAGIESVEAAVALGWADRRAADDLAGHEQVMAQLKAERYLRRARHLRGELGATAPPGSAPGDDLTPRQREIATLVAEGLSNAEIAERLYLSVRTVESHLDHIYTRLGFASRVRLATTMTRGGLRDPTEAEPGLARDAGRNHEGGPENDRRSHR